MSDLRCADWMRADGADPIGTAGSYAGYLLVEWPLPWPRDIGEVPELAPVVRAIEGTGVRLQGLVPERGRAERTVVLWRSGPGEGFAGYAARSATVGPDEVVDAACALAGGEERGVPVKDAVVLVCGHGRRDPCCGSLGTRLFGELTTLPDGVRAWRTSHTGGHRFAPTAIVLPQGTVWAFADTDLVRRVIERAGPHDELLARYRGCSGVGPGPVQAIEREAFREIGWGWLDWRRHGTVVDPGRGTVRLDAVSPGGERVSWEGVVEVVRRVPVPECGSPIERAKKSEPEYRVVEVERLAPAS